MYQRIAENLKEQIVNEYLFGNLSYRLLALKYGVPHKRIHVWVMKKQGKKPVKKKIEELLDDSPLSNDVAELQKQLREAKLKNKLLTTMIDIAEEQLKIDIRKKSGTKQ